MADDSTTTLPLKKKWETIKRQAVSLSSASLVKAEPMFATGALPLLVEPSVPGLDLAAWGAENGAFLEASLRRHGGILFRHFDVRDAAGLERFIQAVSGGALEYRERSSPRSSVAGNIYTSTDYPPSHPIFLHNENSYQSEWPSKIFLDNCKLATVGEPTSNTTLSVQRTRRIVALRMAPQGMKSGGWPRRKGNHTER